MRRLCADRELRAGSLRSLRPATGDSYQHMASEVLNVWLLTRCWRADTPCVSSDQRPVRVTHAIHDLGPGGAEHVLVDLARVAHDGGIEMSVVSLMPSEGLAYAEALEGAGVRVEALDLKSPWDPRGPRRMQSVLRSLRPDVVHSHLKHADVVAALALRGTGIPQVSTLHVIEDAVTGVARFKRSIAARIRNRRVSRIVAVSDAVRRWYVEELGGDPRRVVTVRNGVPAPPTIGPDERDEVRRRLGVSRETVLAAMVAVMRPGKGHDVLLDAASLITPEVDVTFVLAGDGALETEIRSRAADLPTGRVVMPGFVADVDVLLAAADIVVHPTLADALPTALIQALAASVPVVAANVGGVPEVVGPDAGVLVAPGNPAALAAAVIGLVQDADGRRWMGKKARERFDERFEARNWVRTLGVLYRSLL